LLAQKHAHNQKYTLHITYIYIYEYVLVFMRTMYVCNWSHTKLIIWIHMDNNNMSSFFSKLLTKSFLL
jgi:hypothetical protein